MSFSTDIKHELCALSLSESEKMAQLYGLLLIRSKIELVDEKLMLVFTSTYAFIVKHVYTLIKSLFDLQPEIRVIKRSNLKKNNLYQLLIPEESFEELSELRLIEQKKMALKYNRRLLRSEKNARAFLQGTFLASGSISSPKSTNYHLEITTGFKNQALFIKEMMERFMLPMRIIIRRGNHVIYLKASDRIADYLRLLGASEALFQFEDIRIQRDFYNQFSRLDNCEVANEMKSIKAAREQLDWIVQIENEQLSVDDKILHVIEARKKNPEASIMELCNVVYLEYGEIITKSGMKHRLAKIRELARQIQQKNEEDSLSS